MGRKFQIDQRQLSNVLQIMPFGILFFVLIFGGMAQFGLNGYNHQIWKEQALVESLIFSVIVVMLSSWMAIGMGIFMAYQMVHMRNKWIKKLCLMSTQLAIIIPYLLVAFFIIIMFSRTGFVSRWLVHIGIINDFSQFPVLVYDQKGIGIILAMTIKGAAFVCVIAVHAIMRINYRYAYVANALGASQKQAFLKVILPMLEPVIIWSSCILIAYNLGAYDVPNLIGGIKPEMLSIKMWHLYQRPSVENIQGVMSYNALLLVLSIFLMWIQVFLIKKLIQRSKK